MKLFHCDCCGSLVFFENTKCLKCEHSLGYLPQFETLSALEPAANDTFRALASEQKGAPYRLCDNGRQHKVCNWMVPADKPDKFCVACSLNDLIPDLSVPGNIERWAKLEKAKRRILYTILHLGLPMDAKDKRPALRFKFGGDVAGQPPFMTGHASGVISINIAEADDAEREKRRVNLREPFRTLLGHVRHEVAHYYWDRLIADTEWLPRFRNVFGDETADYGAALKKHYDEGAPSDWQTRHVSEYATTHPWEDWAETWAHYFHIIDMVETASSFGITIKPQHPAAKTMTANLKKVSETDASFDKILENWFPLTYALNSLNRGMGLLDAYPFALSPGAVEKLRFIHEVVLSCGAVGK